MASRLLLDEQPLQILPSLAVKVGLNKAMFLQQLHYWLQRPGAHTRDDKKWVYNTYEEWHEQFPFWSVEVIRKRIVKPLEDAGIIITSEKYNAMAADKTKWYTIDYDALNNLMGEEHTPTLNPPDKIPTPTGQNTHTRTGQNTHTNNQRVPENNNRDSDSQSGGGQKAPPPSKPVSSKSYGIASLMERFEEAKRQGKEPTPPDELYKRRHGDIYAAHLADGYEVEELEPALDCLVAAACGEGPGWLQGKKRWIPLVDAIEYAKKGANAGAAKLGNLAQRTYKRPVAAEDEWKEGYHDHYEDYTTTTAEERRAIARQLLTEA